MAFMRKLYIDRVKQLLLNTWGSDPENGCEKINHAEKTVKKDNLHLISF